MTSELDNLALCDQDGRVHVETGELSSVQRLNGFKCFLIKENDYISQIRDRSIDPKNPDNIGSLKKLPSKYFLRPETGGGAGFWLY